MTQFVNESTIFNSPVIFNSDVIFNSTPTGNIGSSVNSFVAYPDQILFYGPESGSAILGVLTPPAYTGTSVVIESDPARNGGDDDANLYLISAANGGNPAMAHMIYATGDLGLRINYNFIHDETGFRQFDNNFCSQQVSFETDAAIGVNYTRPLVTAAGAYDALPGKDWKFYPGGNPATSVGGAKQKYIFMAVCEPGRGWDLGVETAGTGSGYGTRLRIDDSTNTDPIYLYANSGLRQVKAKDFSLLGPGDTVYYY